MERATERRTQPAKQNPLTQSGVGGVNVAVAVDHPVWKTIGDQWDH